MTLARRVLCILVVMSSLAWASAARAAPLLVNGDFEAEGGSLAGWHVANRGAGDGDWFVQTGTQSPVSGFSVPEPPGPTHAAMTDQFGPGDHVLYQDVVVPEQVTVGTLRFDLFVGNRADAFVAGGQEARVDLMFPSVDPFSVSPFDVLQTAFLTQPGDPLVSGYTTYTIDVTRLLRDDDILGQTIRLRFSEQDSLFYFQLGVDRVDLDATFVPEPTSMLLFGSGLVALTARLRSRGRSLRHGPGDRPSPEAGRN